MNNVNNQKCAECGKLLQSSQYPRLIKEGESAEKEGENLFCRNYPNCSLSEKEVD